MAGFVVGEDVGLEEDLVPGAVDLVRRRIARLDARLLVQHLLGIGHPDDIVRINENRLKVEEGDADNSRLALPNATE